jgi:hypothetical protein
MFETAVFEPPPPPQLRNTENIMYTVISDAKVLLKFANGNTFKTVSDLLVCGLDDCVVWWKEPDVGTMTG